MFWSYPRKKDLHILCWILNLSPVRCPVPVHFLFSPNLLNVTSYVHIIVISSAVFSPITLIAGLRCWSYTSSHHLSPPQGSMFCPPPTVRCPVPVHFFFSPNFDGYTIQYKRPRTSSCDLRSLPALARTLAHLYYDYVDDDDDDNDCPRCCHRRCVC